MNVPDSHHTPTHASRTERSFGGASVASAALPHVEVLLADSITVLPDEIQGRFVVSGSHGGVYPALIAAHKGVAGVIFNDAGTGLCGAGIAGLDVLDYLAIPAACVCNFSARIGDASDTLNRGRLSFSNRCATAIGWTPGTRVVTAFEAGINLHNSDSMSLPHPVDHRLDIKGYSTKVVAMDSASLVTSQDADSIIVTGSHGGRIGNRTGGLRYPVRGAVFNDAGFGADLAGVGRLRLLDEDGIPAATVSNHSARIGDGLSTLHSGVVSALNGRATRVGGRTGMPASEFIALLSRGAEA